jgi:pimeloyl-ACP methyl ester carboxylesterase
MRVWAARLKSHEFAPVTESGHSIAGQQPEQFNRAVFDLIERH